MPPTQEQTRQIANLIMSTEGRNALASALAQPLRERLNYESIGRRVFSIQPLPDGAIPVTQNELLESGQIGNIWGAEIITSEIVAPIARRVTIPLFELSSNPQIPFSEIRERRFNLIDRANEIERNSYQDDYDLALIKAREKLKQERKVKKEFKIEYRRLKKVKNKYKFIQQL